MKRSAGRWFVFLAFLVTALLVSGEALAGWNWNQGSFNPEGGFERRYVPPLTNILFNESPYITTEASLWYWYQTIPDDSITLGGHVNLVAAEARVALTDRLAFIATKDGYADIHFGTALKDTEGAANVVAGLKYALFEDPKEDYIVTVGARYEIPVGNIDTSGVSLQGHGDGMLDLFVSAARNWDKFGLEANVGTNIAMNSADNTSQLHYSVHADYELFPHFFPLIEFNGITPIDEGERVALNLEGHDVLNLGSSGLGTTATLGVGFRYAFNDHAQAGVAWEETVTDREDLFESRLTVNLLLYF